MNDVNFLLLLESEGIAGWKDAIQPLVDYADEHNIKILQIKEKFGGLRFYCAVHNDDDIADTMSAMIEHAETLCETLCESCGKPDQKIRYIKGWATTRCDECIKK